MQRHRHQEFIGFLNAVEVEVPAEKPIHAILENYATHKHPKGHGLVARASSALDFPLHPDLGLVAQRGREFLLQNDTAAHSPRRVPLDRRPAGRHQCYLAEHNASPKPFVWTKTADAILANSIASLYLLFDRVH